MQVEETTPSTPLRPTRAGFVRGLPLTMPVEEVIERGREIGIELQPSDIHAARYYMRQVAAADSSSIPQQLLLGGTFVTKREPRAGNGAASKAASASTQALEKAAAMQQEAEARARAEARAQDDQDGEDGEHGEHGEHETAAAARSVQASAQASAMVAPKRRGRPVTKTAAKVESKVQSKLASKAEKADKADLRKAKGANGLHSRLQARLRHVTFRDTAREERDAARTEKATIGKALLNLDAAVKPRGKRGVQTAEALEDQVRLIALRVGTQRVRELLDEMEERARRA